jgi:hypothetical protein
MSQYQHHTRGLSGELMVEPDFAGRPATSSGAQMFLGGGGGGETHRVLRGNGGSSDRLAMASDLPAQGHALTSPARHSGGGSGGHHDGNGAAAHPSPTRPRLPDHVSLAGLRGSPTKSGIPRRALAPKKVWRSRVRQGLTLVHFSAQRRRFLWDTLGVSLV